MMPKKQRTELVSLATASANVVALVDDMKALDKLSVKSDPQLRTLIGSLLASFLALQTYLASVNRPAEDQSDRKVKRHDVSARAH